MWGLLAKQMVKGGIKKVAKDKLLNRKKKRPKKRRSGKEVSQGIMNNGGEEGKKGGALAVTPTTGLVHSAKDFDPVSTSVGESDIVIIRKQVIQVRDILKDTHSAKEQERNNLRKAKQVDKKKKVEDKIEKPKIKPKEAKAGMKVPNLGLGIGNFLTWLAIGVVFAKLKDLMPTLKKIFGVLKFVTDFIGNVLNLSLGFVVGFIDLAYAGVDNLRKLIVAIGGEGAGELFDKFGRLFTQVMNGALIAAMIGAVIGQGRRRVRRVKGDGKIETPKWKKRLNRWFKKTPTGKFVRNQKARLLKLTRNISKGPLGKVASVLNPKNIGNWINTGGIDKSLKGGFKNVTNVIQNLTKNIQLPKSLQKIQPLKTIQNLTKDIKLPKIQPLKTIQNLTKDIKLPTPKIQPLKTIQNLTKDIKLPKIELPKGKPGGGGFFSGIGKKLQIGKRFSQGKELLIKGKDATITGISKGIKFLAEIPGNVIDAVKEIKWGELPGVKFMKGAYEGITGNMMKWVDEVGKNLSPGKMIQGLLDQAKPTIDDILAKNPALQKLGSQFDPKKFVPWIADNLEGFKKQAEPIANAVKGNKALKSVSNFLGPADLVIDSMFALIDYTVGKESLVNAVVKALSSTLGFAAGAAAGAALGTTITAAAAGTGVGAGAAAAMVPMIPYITFGMGMGGAYAGEFLGNKILEGIVKMAPGLADIDDPIAEELGFGPRKLMRDPFAPNPFKNEDDQAKTDTNTNNNLIASSNGNNNIAEGLDTKTSYGEGRVVENNTTYIQEVEVPA